MSSFKVRDEREQPVLGEEIERLFRERPQDSEVRQRMQAVRDVYFSDFQTCDMHGGALVERAQMLEPAAYHETCGVCPKNPGTTLFSFVYRGEQSLPAFRQVRDAWRKAYEELQAIQLDFGASSAGALDPKLNAASRQRARAERDAWITYAVTAHDFVANHVLRTGKGEFARGPSWPGYLAFLAEFDDDAAKRRSSFVISTPSEDKHHTYSWCHVHQRAGHLLPVLGAAKYDPACFRCPVRAPSLEFAVRKKKNNIALSDEDVKRLYFGKRG